MDITFKTIREHRAQITGPSHIELVVPVHNAEEYLERGIERLRRYADEHLAAWTVITIADRASTDRTWQVAQRLCRTLTNVEAIRLDREDRGDLMRTRRRSAGRVPSYEVPLDWAGETPALIDDRDERPAMARQIASFAIIGVLSTAAYAALYLMFRVSMSSEIANGAALVLTAIANTAANRRLTFGITDRAHLLRDHAAGLLAFGFALAITTIAAAAMEHLGAGMSRMTELVVLISANALATIVRFAILRFSIAGATRRVAM